MKKFISSLGILLILIAGVFAFPSSVAAKCPDAPSDLVCAELQHVFLPERPVPEEEVTIVAYWVEQRTAERVSNVQWLARRGNPAYLWLWDHEPSELESIAYVEGMEGKAELPQMMVPLQWDSQQQEYQGTFVLPKSGRWSFRLGTVVPDALQTSMEADFDYVGPIQSIDLPAATKSLLANVSRSMWPVFILGGGLAISVLRWLHRLPQKYNNYSPS